VQERQIVKEMVGWWKKRRWRKRGHACARGMTVPLGVYWPE
jgi:hypothetical protein